MQRSIIWNILINNPFVIISGILHSLILLNIFSLAAPTWPFHWQCFANCSDNHTIMTLADIRRQSVLKQVSFVTGPTWSVIKERHFSLIVDWNTDDKAYLCNMMWTNWPNQFMLWMICRDVLAGIFFFYQRIMDEQQVSGEDCVSENECFWALMSHRLTKHKGKEGWL